MYKIIKTLPLGQNKRRNIKHVHIIKLKIYRSMRVFIEWLPVSLECRCQINILYVLKIYINNHKNNVVVIKNVLLQLSHN